MVLKDVVYTPGRCQNGSEKHSEVVVGKAAQKKGNQYLEQCPRDFPAKMPRGAGKKFCMLRCLQFLKSTLGTHEWHFEKSSAI